MAPVYCSQGGNYAACRVLSSSGDAKPGRKGPETGTVLAGTRDSLLGASEREKPNVRD